MNTQPGNICGATHTSTGPELSSYEGVGRRGCCDTTQEWVNRENYMKKRSGIQVIAFSVVASVSVHANRATADVAEAANTCNCDKGIEEIVVTAQKRSEDIQSVPMSITAFSNHDLVTRGIASFQDYALDVPNLSFAYAGDVPGEAQTVAIRGIFGSNTTGFYLDDTPLPESIDPRVVDLSRIEVLKGPQGTLYGARSEGGTIRLITSQPDDSTTSGYVHGVGSGTKDGGANYSIDGAINMPVIQDRLAIRLNAYDEVESGFLSRAASSDAPVPFETQKDINAVHYSGGAVAATAKFLEDGALSITPRILVQNMSEPNPPYADYSAGNSVNYRLFNNDEPATDAFELYSLTAKYYTRVGEITSDTSEFHRRSTASEDSSEVIQLLTGLPPTSVIFHIADHNSNFAEEARFASTFNGPFQLTTGVFYSNELATRVAPPTPDGDFISDLYNGGSTTQVKETAVFGEATYSIVQRLKLIAGGRWFDNRVDYASEQNGITITPFSFAGAQHESGFNPKFGLQYAFTADALAYATAAKGFRIGGVNTFDRTLCAADIQALGLTVAQAETYKSDTVWSYEIGGKTSWLDRHVTVDAAIFDIEWSGVQQGVSLPTCGFAATLNAGHARSQGGELEVKLAVTQTLKLSFGSGYTDAHITDSGAADVFQPGTPIEEVPKWTANAALDYTPRLYGLPTLFHAEYSHIGSSISDITSAEFPLDRNAYNLAKVRAGFNLASWELGVFADNIFNEHANLSDVTAVAIALPGRPRIAIVQPRTIGVDIRLRF